MSESPETILANRLKSELQNCTGFQDDAASRNRKDAFDYYFQRPRGDEKIGRSNYVSGDMSAMTEAVAAQMMEAFSAKQIVDYDSLGPEDEEQAQLESAAVQYLVMGTNKGRLQIKSAIKEALMCRNGVAYIDAQDKRELKTRRLGNVEPDALAELLADDDIVSHDYDEDTKELSVTKRVTSRRLVVESKSMENFLYHAQWYENSLAEIPVCAIRHVDTRMRTTPRP